MALGVAWRPRPWLCPHGYACRGAFEAGKPARSLVKLAVIVLLGVLAHVPDVAIIVLCKEGAAQSQPARLRCSPSPRRLRSLTPLITLVRSVTVDTTRREMRWPSSKAEPSKTEWAPGSRGNHLLSTVVELSKLVCSKSVALTVLRCSEWFRSLAVSVPESELAPAQAGAKSTKINVIVAKLMRRSLTYFTPLSLLPGGFGFRGSLRFPEAEVQGGQRRRDSAASR